MIELENVGKHYAGAPVVDGLSLVIGEGEFFVLIGSSGSGKSTTLKMINRLIEADTGAIRIGGRDIRAQPAERLRLGIGYAIQSVGLFPHWTVAANIATVPRLLGWPPARTRARVEALMALLQLDAGLAGRRPHELSGGQQQRVGVARALAADPAIVLMDEPFGALDPLTRDALQAQLAKIHADTGKTIVFVTHDMDEALRLGTRIAVLDRGRLVQSGTPAQLLGAPASDFVRDFVGGAEAGLRRLGIVRVRERLRPGEAVDGPAIDAEATLKEALALMVAHRCERLAVRDGEGRVLGSVALADLVRG